MFAKRLCGFGSALFCVVGLAVFFASCAGFTTYGPKRAGACIVVASATSERTAYVDYVCDGIDDQKEIQSAIDSLPQGPPIYGGTVTLTEGTYFISAPITLRDGVTIQGQGIHSTKLQLADFANCNVFEWSPPTTENFVSLRDMRINGNKDTNAIGRGLFLDKSNAGLAMDLLVIRVWFHRFPQEGIYHDGGQSARYQSVWIEECDSGGIKQFSPQCHFTDCYIAENEGDSAVYLGDLYGATMEGTIITDNASVGLELFSTTESHISVISKRNDYEGILLNGDSESGNCEKNLLLANCLNNNRRGTNTSDVVLGPYTYSNSLYVEGYPSIHIKGSDNRIYGAVSQIDHFEYDYRNAINDVGRQSCAPTSCGRWQKAGYEGLIVWDTSTSPWSAYQYVGGTWRKL